MKQKLLITTILILVILGNLYSQNVYRTVEGGRQLVPIDKTTPLLDLIKRLESPWSPVETGKSYWIGYTDDMFSIAQYKRTAIDPLKELIDNSNSYQAKIGALNTLHLIGTDCKVTGRFSEIFKDTIARNAILSCLNVPELHYKVLLLLGRDPWTTDIPVFMEYLTKPENDFNYMLSTLQKYDVENKPVGQELENILTGKDIVVQTTKLSEYRDVQELRALQLEVGDSIEIDENILNSSEWFHGLELLKNEPTSSKELPATWVLESATDSFFADSYCELRSRFFFVYDGSSVIKVYEGTKTREIWLDWWELLKKKR